MRKTIRNEPLRDMTQLAYNVKRNK